MITPDNPAPNAPDRGPETSVLSIVEQATRRLEVLRQAGFEAPLPGRRSAAPAVSPRMPAFDARAAADAARAVVTPEARRAPEAPRPEPSRPQVADAAPPTPRSAKVTPLRPDWSKAEWARRDAPTVSATPAPQPAKSALPARQPRQIDVDVRALAAAGYVMPDAPRSQLIDEFRVIKRPLLDNIRRRTTLRRTKSNCIMVTSSVQGEGKTFTSINLALSIANEIDTRVLLVDADVLRPAVLDRLGLPPSRGLLDLLVEPETEALDVILRTNIGNLELLPTGTPHDRAADLLASERMSRLVEELSTRYADRILVFDAPPLLGSAEARVLATQVGQVVVVVEAGRTRRARLAQALATVEACPLVMTLLNRSRLPEVPGDTTYART